MNKKIGIYLVTLSLSLCLISAELIEGDKDAPEGQTFSFSVNKNILSANGNFYEGANEVLTQFPQYSLSRLAHDSKEFMPLMPESIMLNGQVHSSNPLFGAKIIALGLLQKEVGFFTEDTLIAVGENRPATVYLFENLTNPGNTSAASSQDLHDATGAVSSGIVDLTTNIKNHVFAAVKPNVGEFGDINSGIALLTQGTMEVALTEEELKKIAEADENAQKKAGGSSAKENKKAPETEAEKKEEKKTKKVRVFSEVNAKKGLLIPTPQALRLDPTSPALFIGDRLSNIVKNQIAMYWDSVLERLFIGLQTTSNSDSNDGARAIAIVKFKDDGSITLGTIAPDSVFISGNSTSIIGVRGANQQVSIHALKTMYTSTALSYLIVVGNVGDPASTQQSVFALPLVNSGDARGMIAQKNAQPQNIFKDAPVPRIDARTISEPATTVDEMVQSTDIAAQVGGGKLLAGPIVNIIVRDDTVFAFVGENNSGVYSSQAIFDAAGKIIAWTQWQRAAGTTDAIFGAALNPFDGNFILASGTTPETVNTIKRTIWSDGSPQSLQPLTLILNVALPANDGGIQGLQTFLPHSPGIQDVALLAAGGIGAIVLAQTGQLETNNIIIPTLGEDFTNFAEFIDGTITTDVDATTVIISGGALTTIGPVTALEIARNASNGWLFVGGSNGLAILAQPDGTGWDPATQLSDNFGGLQAGMQFKIIGNYSFVKKLVHDGDFLFVITHDTIDRINLTTSDFATNMLDVTTIAHIGSDGVSTRGGFLDGIFSQALGIIATTDGLFRIGTNKDVRTIPSERDAQWTVVSIGENAGAPTALYTVTQTNRPQDITRNSGGHFYVLTASAYLDQSRINRFAVAPLALNQPMSSTTIQAFDDLFVKNIPSFLLSFGEFRSNFSTDGALYFATRNQNNVLPPVVFLTPASPEPRVGFSNVGDRSMQVTISFGIGTEINYFARSAASGSWIAAGNFNTQVLE